MKGKKTKLHLRPDIIEQYSGKFKAMTENDIRRLIIKMLILKVLKEQFVT